jgi:GNAT superfamily N-acetyltransferase
MRTVDESGADVRALVGQAIFSRMVSPLKIVELQTDGQIAAAYPLMSVLRPRVGADAFVHQVRAQQREGYRLLGGAVNDEWVVLAGYRLATTLSRGPHLFVDDLVTAPQHQGKGYATALLRHLAALARDQGLEKVWLDSRDTARTFYEQVGFTMHTATPCWIDVARLT